jgi:hypothetical protein
MNGREPSGDCGTTMKGGIARPDESYRSFVYGIVSVSDFVFGDLWERVKPRVALPCDVSLEVCGLELDISPGLRDRWDVKKQPKLKVLSAEFRFAIGEPGSIVTAST